MGRISAFGVFGRVFRPCVRASRRAPGADGQQNGTPGKDGKSKTPG